jgi:hypothetical protein
MQMQTAACLAATMIVGLTGCSSTHAINRGQSVQQTGHHNVNTLPNRTGRVDSIQNHFHDHHAFPDTSTYHSTTGFPGYSGFAESGYGGGHHACPPGGCPSGHCGAGCGHACGPHHCHSYSYQRPGNLTYPDQNAVGGAVVYP